MSETTGQKQNPNLFKPGQSGNPKGRPKGSRNKLGEKFIDDLYADWKEHGVETLVTMREEKPADYVKVVASLLPSQLEVKRPEQELSDTELADLIDAIQQQLAVTGAPKQTHGGSKAAQ